MRQSIRSRVLAAVLGAAALGGSAAVQAGRPIHVDVNVHAGHGRVVEVQPAPVYPAPPEVVYLPQHQGYATTQYRGPRGGQAAGCAAERWHPAIRYMPGQVVWRKGSLWVAKHVSARVWNENSPPEWTPQYWLPAVCR